MKIKITIILISMFIASCGSDSRSKSNSSNSTSNSQQPSIAAENNNQQNNEQQNNDPSESPQDNQTEEERGNQEENQGKNEITNRQEKIAEQNRLLAIYNELFLPHYDSYVESNSKHIEFHTNRLLSIFETPINLLNTISSLLGNPIDLLKDSNDIFASIKNTASAIDAKNNTSIKRFIDTWTIEDGDHQSAEILEHLSGQAIEADRPLEQYEINNSEFPLIENGDIHNQFDNSKYYSWQSITLPVETGASCGNGIPYTFYVNLSPMSKNLFWFKEPGGMCFNKSDCSNQTLQGSFAPTKLVKDVMLIIKGSIQNTGNPLIDNIINNAITQLETEIASFANSLAKGTSSWDNYGFINPITGAGATMYTSRVNLSAPLKTQKWNQVLMPYCTGDMHTGDRIRAYREGQNDSQPLIVHHKGLRNTLAVLAWTRNHLPQPKQLAVVGTSAGAFGSTITFNTLNRILEPEKSYLIADSVMPIFQNDLAPLYNKNIPKEQEQTIISDAYASLLITDVLKNQYTDISKVFGYLSQGMEHTDNVKNLDFSFWSQDLANKYDNARLAFTTPMYDSVVFPEFAAAPQYFPRLKNIWLSENPHHSHLGDEEILKKISLFDHRETYKSLMDKSNIGLFVIDQNQSNHIVSMTVLQGRSIWEGLDSKVQAHGLWFQDYVHNVLSGEGEIMKVISRDMSMPDVIDNGDAWDPIDYEYIPDQSTAITDSLDNIEDVTSLLPAISQVIDVMNN